MATDRARVAVQAMVYLCECPEHGYSQLGRYGSGYCDVTTDIGVIRVKRGGLDCSSAVCEAWDGILHYVGGSIDGNTPSDGVEASCSSSWDLPVPRFHVAIMRGKILVTMYEGHGRRRGLR